VASIYARGNVLWCRVKDEADKWISRPTPFRPGEDAKAQRYADAAQAAIDERRTGGTTAKPMSVSEYAEQWLTIRREMHEATRARYEAAGTGRVQYRDHATDAGRMRKHVISHLGTMRLADVRPRHLAEWIHYMRTKTTLAPHTVRNVYGLVTAMFRDAAVAGHVESSPAILTKTQLGEDDGSADGAGRYSREHLALMLGSAALPEHARVFAALGGLAGLRLGAIAGLRWGDLDTTATPLWRLTSSRTYDGKPTKTGKASVVPVHPVLAEMLASWRHGWGQMFGRAPAAEDPIVPRAPGKWRDAPGTPHTEKTGGDLMDDILTTLAIPAAPMKVHALRSTFISMALEDGADDRLIERITHTPGKSRRAFDRYDRADYWPQLCAEVAKLAIVPRSLGRVVRLATVLATGGGTYNGSGMLYVEAAGIEPASENASG
jgi:integrase